ncbi:PQQ-dependent sugar dehydrogenase [Flavitalea flava]
MKLFFCLPAFFVCFWLVGESRTTSEYPKISSRTDSVPTRPIKTGDSFEVQLRLDSTVIGSRTLLSNLDVPWDLEWGQDNRIWFTQQEGTVTRVDPLTGQTKQLIRITDVYRNTSQGLLGMALHPDMKNNPYVYLDYTYLGKDSTIWSKLVRYTYTGDTLTDPFILLGGIPGQTYHNGSRMTIAPDGKLMLSTGDAGGLGLPQDIQSINGKILRLNLDGSIPADNPVKGSPVWSYGHRNPQGIVYGPNGLLYSSEHGEASDDEINLIRKGGNYGWPDVMGYIDRPAERAYSDRHAIVQPLKAWTPVIAPSGIDFYHHAAIPEWNQCILMTTLKDCSFRVLSLNEEGDSITKETVLFDKVFGRMRDVCISPQGDVYLATSNRDWHPTCDGFPKRGDDRIIRISRIRTIHKAKSIHEVRPVKSLNTRAVNSINPAGGNSMNSAPVIYQQYCSACHGPAGKGLAGSYPALTESSLLEGDKNTLIRLVLQGSIRSKIDTGHKYAQQMPAFDFLSDPQIAGVLGYIRTNFGNIRSGVLSKEVSVIRAKTGKN